MRSNPRDIISNMEFRARSFNGRFAYETHDWLYALEYFMHRCAVCGEEEAVCGTLQADHWIPLSCGGDSTPGNVVPLCKSCNSSKNTRRPEQWLTWRYGDEVGKEIQARITEFFRAATIPERPQTLGRPAPRPTPRGRSSVMRLIRLSAEDQEKLAYVRKRCGCRSEGDALLLALTVLYDQLQGEVMDTDGDNPRTK